MGSELLMKLTDWMESSNFSNSLVGLLESYGLSKVVWMVLSSEDIHVIENSTKFDPNFLKQMQDESGMTHVKSWVKESLNQQININSDYQNRIVLYAKSDYYNNLTVVISDQPNLTKFSMQDLRFVTRIALNFINKKSKIKTLQNALRIGIASSGPKEYSNDISNITVETLKASFIKSVVPHVFYAFVHENYGPFVYESVPDEMRTDPNYIITAVKLFSSIDADMIAEVGHLFTIDPIKKPELGETFSIIYTLPSKSARGSFEVHSMSALIPHQFFNISKSLVGEMKTIFFMYAEQIRILHEENNWSLGVTPMEGDLKVYSEITQILTGMRKDIALNFALKMDPADVMNW